MTRNPKDPKPVRNIKKYMKETANQEGWHVFQRALINSLGNQAALGPRSPSSRLGRKGERSNSSPPTPSFAWLCLPVPSQLDVTSNELSCYIICRGLPSPHCLLPLFARVPSLYLSPHVLPFTCFPHQMVILRHLPAADTSPTLNTVFGQDRCSINSDRICE